MTSDKPKLPERLLAFVFNTAMRGKIEAIVALLDHGIHCLQEQRNAGEVEALQRLKTARADCQAAKAALSLYLEIP